MNLVDRVKKYSRSYLLPATLAATTTLSCGDDGEERPTEPENNPPETEISIATLEKPYQIEERLCNAFLHFHIFICGFFFERLTRLSSRLGSF